MCKLMHFIVFCKYKLILNLIPASLGQKILGKYFMFNAQKKAPVWNISQVKPFIGHVMTGYER